MADRLPGPWKVSSNPVAGKLFHQVYRMRDITGVDRSGNRETYGGLWETKREAENLAELLNKEGV